jgi:adenylyltransferase/sulfurtransferase
MATDIVNCSEIGTMNSIVGLIASQQVNEVLKLVTGIGKPLANELLIYNSLENTQLKMNLKSTILKDKIAKIFKLQTYFDAACSVQNLDWQISSEDLRLKLNDSEMELIAVLPNLKLPFNVHQTIPIHQFDADKFNVDYTKTYVMVCQRGFNSYKATKLLKEKYPNLNVLNLSGGISSYNK